MQQKDLMDVLVLEKKMFGKLTEVLDITGQMAEATDRNDQVSVQLLLSMRQEPIEQLRQTEERLGMKQSELSTPDQLQMELLTKGGTSEEPFERMLSEQVASNRRLLERVLALDKRVNRKLGGDDSCYS